MTTTPIRSSFGARGSILQIRNGEIYRNHAAGAITASEFGTSLTTALAAVSPGDTLAMRGFTATGKNWSRTVNNVRILCDDVTLLLDGNDNYAYGLQLNGDDLFLSGLTIDGGGIASGAANVYGIYISGGDRVTLDNCSTQDVLGPDAATAGIWFGTSNDGLVRRCSSLRDGWFGLVNSNSNRFTLDGFRCTDPKSRALNPTCSVPLDWMSYRNLHLTQSVATTSASIMLNLNFFATVSDFYLENALMFHADVVSAGVSWNDGSSSVSLLKMQDVTRMRMARVQMLHGVNQANLSQSWRIESTSFPGIDELYIDDCVFAGGVQFAGQRSNVMRFRNTTFGAWHNDLTSSLILDLAADDFESTACTYNSYTTPAIRIGLARLATDKYRWLDNSFTTNSGSNTTIFHSNPLRTSIGNLIFAGNKFDNTGAGTMNISASELDTLALSTDRNGDLLFDSDLIGTGAGKHPDPGTGPYFVTLTPPSRNGLKIHNIHWSPDLTQLIPEKAWIAHNGAWKEYT